MAGSRWRLTFAKYDWRSRDAQNERLPGRQGRHGVRSSRLACRIQDSVFVSIALAKDDTAIVFGEDVAFGGVFRCTMVSHALFLRYSILICLTLVGLGRRVWWAMRLASVSPMIQPSARSGTCLQYTFIRAGYRRLRNWCRFNGPNSHCRDTVLRLYIPCL